MIPDDELIVMLADDDDEDDDDEDVSFHNNNHEEDATTNNNKSSMTTTSFHSNTTDVATINKDDDNSSEGVVVTTVVENQGDNEEEEEEEEEDGQVDDISSNGEDWEVKEEAAASHAVTTNAAAAVVCTSSDVLLPSSSEKKKKKTKEVISSSSTTNRHHHPSSKLISSSSSSSSLGNNVFVTNDSNNDSNNNNNNNNNNSNNKSTTTSTTSSIPSLATLPIDAIHSISTYCTLNDWITVCTTSKIYYYDIGTIIISKIYGHVYRCALEVAYCWARGEHADARELAALYTSSGVPIYPAPHGHSYRTLAWRMGLELDKTVTTTRGGGDGNNDGGVEERGVGEEEEEEHQEGNVVVEGNIVRRGEGGRIDTSTSSSSSSTTNKTTSTTTDAFYLERYRENVNDANNERRNAGFARRGGGGGGGGDEQLAAAAGENNNVVNNNNNNNNNQHGDGGHRRGDHGGRGGGHPLSSRDHTRSLTYVEEKAIFWKRNMGIEVTDDRHSFSSPFPLRDIPFRDAPQARFPRRLLARGPPPPLPPLEPRNVPVPIDGNERYPDEVDVDDDGGGLQNILHILDPRTRCSRSSTASTITLVEEVADVTSTRRNSEDLNNIPHPLLEEEVTLQTPKLTIRVHRHLFDQHLFGTPAVDDENGTMNTGKISMSADFFHPRWEGRKCASNNAANGYSWDDTTAWRRTAAGMEEACFNNDHDAPPQVNIEDNIGETARDGAAVDNNYRAAVRSFVSWTMANTDRHQRRNSLPAWTGRGARLPLSMMFNPTYGASASLTSQSNLSPASDVHLELYSSTSANLKPDNENDPATSDAIIEMRSRCAHYQKRFDSILKTNFDTYPFQECLLDFWDEVFPSTAGIHFYNQQSPVPRMSQLHTFLTTPCPKAIGTIQCEIERVKITGKDSKGANRVKGRFFPSYEYRLFIKDTRNDHPFHSRHCPRKDSVLLVATNKRRGSKSSGLDFSTPSGLMSPSGNGGGGGASKRGMTNYFMCLPQKVDVDSHYKSSNRNNTNVTILPGESSGMALSPLAIQTKQSVVVGRLQSNFIGTEFQIYVPTGIQTMGVVSSEDNQTFAGSATTDADDGVIEGDNRVHPIDVLEPVDATNSTSRRKSRKGGDIVRLARRASSSISGRGSSRSNIIASAVGGDPAVNHSDVSRRKFFYSKRMRAIANSSVETTSTYPSELLCTNLDPLSLSSLDSSTSTRIVEEENGAITYTANLLGNRPRIMDVCIPKLTVSEDGAVFDEWREWRREQESFINVGSNNSNSAMLNRFKYILNSMSLLEENDNVNGQIRPINNPGLMLLQNRPPWWNIELGAFVLNFGGRVKVASVKNFQLCERDVQDHIVQFGRIEGRHSFTMDFQYPLTPMQAFAIAISSLQSKISFG